jgi:hypothetical protein
LKKVVFFWQKKALPVALTLPVYFLYNTYSTVQAVLRIRNLVESCRIGFVRSEPDPDVWHWNRWYQNCHIRTLFVLRKYSIRNTYCRYVFLTFSSSIRFEGHFCTKNVFLMSLQNLYIRQDRDRLKSQIRTKIVRIRNIEQRYLLSSKFCRHRTTLNYTRGNRVI